MYSPSEIFRVVSSAPSESTVVREFPVSAASTRLAKTFERAEVEDRSVYVCGSEKMEGNSDWSGGDDLYKGQRYE